VSFVATLEATDLRNSEIRFESPVPIRKSRADSQISESAACPLLVVVKRLKPLTALSGAVYRLASSMSDHTPPPVLFNVFDDWNEELVFLHISFDSI